MPELDDSNRPDPTDLADDDVRSITDDKTREAIYRVTKKIKECLLYQEQLIIDLYEAVTAIEEA
jgi:hypothetical protein